MVVSWSSGRPGRNFGAGMSGGIAYVYDLDDGFASLVNYEMVTLEDLDDTDRGVPAHDRRHVTVTSPGRRWPSACSTDWDTEVARFRKVMPTDYKRVLTVIAHGRRPTASTSEQTVERIMEAASVIDEEDS